MALVTTRSGLQYQKEDMEEGAAVVLHEKHGRNDDTRPPKTRGEFEEERIEVTLAKARKRKGGPRKRSRDAVKHNVFTLGGSDAEDRSGNHSGCIGKTSSKELHMRSWWPSLKKMMWRSTCDV